MFPVDDPTASAVRPAPAAAGAPGFFVEGDPVAGVQGTLVHADWLNAVQGELLAILVAVGIAPDKNNLAQVAGALPRIVPGSLIFPSGLIINYGNATQQDGTGRTRVVFATPFAQGVLVPLAVNHAGGPPSAFHGVGAQDKNGMDVWSSSATGQAAAAGVNFYWIAIGR